MTRFEIIVKVNGVDYYLDTTDVDPVNINFSIGEISDISTRNSSFSKSITIPDNKDNREVFGFISELSSSGELFNANKRSKCYILVDSVVVMDGYLQLKSIYTEPETGSRRFEVVVYADNGNFWTLLGDKYLTDSDYSEYNHTYGTSSVISSWGADYGYGYFYGLGDYGQDWRLNDLNGTTGELKIKDFMPSVYIKTIWNKIFSDAEYSYSSEFLNSEKFNNLLSPFNGSALTVDPEFIANYSFAVGLTSSKTITATFSGAFLLDKNKNWGMYKTVIPLNYEGSPYSDPANAYSTGSYSWTNTTTNIMSTGFYINLDLMLQWTYPGSTISYYSLFDPMITPGDLNRVDYAQSIAVYRSMDPFTGAVDPYFDQEPDPYLGTLGPQYACPIWGGGAMSLDLWTQANSKRQYGTFSFSSQNPYPNYQFTVNRFTDTLDGRANYVVGYTSSRSGGGPMGNRGYTYSYDNKVFTQARPGERFKLVLRRVYANYDHPSTPTNPTIRSIIGTSSYMASHIDTTPWLGAPIGFNSIIPKKIKQKDFISSIIKMFNLYIEPSRDQLNTLIIEPRDDYYEGGTTRDWTDKVDISQPVTQQLISDMMAKQTLFTYKSDSDWYNEDYTSKTGDIYGQYIYSIDNDFIVDNKSIELIFSPTPITNVKDSAKIIIPKIFKVNTNKTTGVAGHYDFNMRVLSRGTIGTYSTGDERIIFEGVTYSYYPYIGHFDDPFNPTYDINFGEAIESYNGGVFGWDRYVIPNVADNLFQTYYSKMMDEFSNKASKIITCYINLNSTDINLFRFNDLIFLDIDGSGQYYRVNKIDSYDPTTTRPTKVELIKTVYVPREKNRNADGTSLAYDGTPIVIMPPETTQMSMLVAGSSNTVTGQSNVVAGNSNTVGGSGNFVSGNNNLTGTGDGNIITGNGNNIQGSSNVVSLGQFNDVGFTNQGVIAIGDFNVVKDGSKALIVGLGNSVCSSGKAIIFGEENMASTSDAPSMILGSGNIVGTDSNALIFGDDNTIGTNSSGIVVFGSGITATQSNTVYFNNITITGTVSGFGAIDTNQVAFGTGTGITSSDGFKFINGNIINAYGGSTPVVTSTYSSVISSQNGNIYNSYWSSVISSQSDSIIKSCFTTMIGQSSGVIYGSAFSNILGGISNQVAHSCKSSIIGGSDNVISTDSNSSIIGGQYNQIGTSSNSSVIGGQGNKLIGGGSYPFICESSILGGKNNCIINTFYTYGTSVIGGSDNKITTGGRSSILGGSNNCISTSYQSSIIGGVLNNICNASHQSSSIGGLYNTLILSDDSSMIGGCCNRLDWSVDSGIINGFDQTMCRSHHSSIIGGRGNTMSSMTASVILGSINKTLSPAITSKNETTLVTNFIVSGSMSTINGSTYSYGYDGSTSIGTFKNGLLVSVSSATSSVGFITLTQSEALYAATSSMLTPGQRYLITDAVGGYSGNELVLTAFDESNFFPDGIGKFYVPTYSNTVYKDWLFLSLNGALIPGSYTNDEYVNMNNGAVGIVRVQGATTSILIERDSGNTWSGITIITGSSSGTSYVVSSYTLPSYATGSTVIYGGKKWTSNNGKLGNRLNKYRLDSNWTFVTFSATEYDVEYDYIKYDIEQDSLLYREDKRGNKIYDVVDFRWGDTDVNDNIQTSATGSFDILNDTLPFYRNLLDDVYYNYGYTIYDNTLRGIYRNTPKNQNSEIFQNLNNYIFENMIQARIFQNSNRYIISHNSNSGDIEGNSNGGNIRYNSNSGNIIHNSNSEFIELNSNSGSIIHNSNSGYIDSNSNSGHIVLNSNSGIIRDNSNSGSIYHNINNGGIISNSSAGDISDTIVNK